MNTEGFFRVVRVSYYSILQYYILLRKQWSSLWPYVGLFKGAVSQELGLLFFFIKQLRLWAVRWSSEKRVPTQHEWYCAKYDQFRIFKEMLKILLLISVYDTKKSTLSTSKDNFFCSWWMELARYIRHSLFFYMFVFYRWRQDVNRSTSWFLWLLTPYKNNIWYLGYLEPTCRLPHSWTLASIPASGISVRYRTRFP